MGIVKFILDEKYGDYLSRDASDIKMCILGNFLGSDVYHPASFIEWGLTNKWDDETNGNCTFLKKEGGYILLSDLYSEEENPTILKMTSAQFLQVLTDWEEKVLKLRPKEVVIKYENDQFIFETKF